MAKPFVRQPAADAFGGVAPENNLLLHVDDAEACDKAFEDAATDVGVVK